MDGRKGRLAAVSAIGIVGLFGLAACAGDGGGGPATGSPVDDLELVDSTPARTAPVDAVKWLLSSEPVTLDGDKESGTPEDTVLANVCDRLFQLQPDLTTKPWVAEGIDYPTDKSAVITLRDDVVGRDGGPITADDVVFSLQRHAAEGADEADSFQNVSAIRKTGDHEITLDLMQPDIGLEVSLAGVGGIVYDQDVVETAGAEFGSPGAPDGCTGIYEVSDWKAGTSLTLARNDAYWGGNVEDAPQKVTFSWADSTAAVNALSTGSVDGAYFSTPELVPALSGKGDAEAYFGPSTYAYSAAITDRGGLKDARIRTALSLAIDRAGIAKAGFQNFVEPWRTPVGPGAWGYERDEFQAAMDEIDVAPASPTKEDIARAKELVAEAGLPDAPVVIASDSSPTRSIMANAIKAAFDSIGVPAEIKTVSEQEVGEFFSKPEVRETADVVPLGWYISRPDPIGFYDNFVTGDGNNWIGYSDPSYDQRVAEAYATLDDTKRAEIVIGIQSTFIEQMLWVPLVSAPNTLVLDKGLTGAPASVAYLSYPWAAQLGKK